MKKLSLIFLMLFFVPWALFAQQYSSSNSKAIKLFEKGQMSLYQSNSSDAVHCFEKAVELDSNFIEPNIMLAEWYLDTRQPNLAKKYYYAAVAVNPAFFPQAWLELGNLELNERNFEKAKENYQYFLQYDKRGDRRTDALFGMKSADFRKYALAHPVSFNPVNLGSNVNSKDDEYLPALTVDGGTLVFTRRFPRKPTTTANTAEEEDFYTSQRIADGWSKAMRMSEPVNSNDNEGAQCVSQDGRVMFFTACGRRDGGGRCDIYMCTNKGDKWSRPRNLGPDVNSPAWESQPSFSIDGKTLYFSSDRKGGYGGKDIWKTVFVNGHWTTPENLGPTINTPGNESSPYIHYDDKTLYFSSDGHVGMGGLDLFLSHCTDTGWETPTNLGYPINTSGDESGLIVAANGATAIYASEREGGFGGQDLYAFELPVEIRAAATFNVKGCVYDKKTLQKLKTSIQVFDVTSEDRVKEVAVVSSDAVDGSYMVSLPNSGSYAFQISADGYLFYSENFDFEVNAEQSSDAPSSFLRDIALTPIEIGESIVLNNVFFAFGTSTLLEESRVDLDKVLDIMQKNTTLKVELAGHTDNIGKPADNQRLSEQRAKAVFDFLVDKGISATRLSYKGYGDTRPVADNDTEEGRAQNRRTTFTIVSK
ncbi:MAG: OmpA family protein [Bacteroidales bacterium]|nr:OmpA family protein [Bacteroidales bacterium]